MTWLGWVVAVAAAVLYVYTLRWAWLDAWREIKFTVAAQRWEGWGRRGDPRNARAELTWEQWRAAGRPWRMPEPGQVRRGGRSRKLWRPRDGWRWPPPRAVQLFRIVQCAMARHRWGGWRIETEDWWEPVDAPVPWAWRMCLRCGLPEHVVGDPDPYSRDYGPVVAEELRAEARRVRP